MNSKQNPSDPPKTPRLTLKKVSKRRYRWLWIVTIVGGVAMLSATAGAFLAMTMASTPLMQRKLSAQEQLAFSKGELSSVNSLQLPELTRSVNILVLGAKVLTTDLGNESASQGNLGYHALVNSFDGLTDTMLLIRFNPATRKVSVLSIPRDTQVEIPGYGTNKINAANSLGGPALSARSVSELMGGISIDRYVTINVQGVEALVDALGGVTVTVPRDMKYQDDSQHLYVNLKAGKQHLNGNQALQLLRFRSDALGDIGRVQRQQMVIRALTEQSLNPVTLARLPQILSVVRSHLDTNLSVEELAALLAFATSIDRANVQMLIVPGEYGDVNTYGTSYWLPNRDRIQTLTAKYFDQGIVPSDNQLLSRLRISVQDTTRRASPITVVTQLKQAGYADSMVIDPVAEPLPTTRIVAQQGDEKSAEMVRSLLGIGEVRVEATGDLESDITIQLGQDWLKR